MDNTSKDNRNNIMWGFLGSLVELGLCKEVELSFLPVGHTHEDIDAFFSRIAAQIRSKKCLTLDDLRDRILKSTLNTVVHVNVIDKVADVAAWILPSCKHWQDSDPAPLHFKWMQIDGVTRWASKLTAGDTDWVPELGGHEFFARPLSLVPPCFVLPRFIDVPKLRELIEKHKPRLAIESEPNAYTWWLDFLDEIENHQKALCPTCLDLLNRIHDILPKKGPAYTRLVQQRNELQDQLSKHRASGCDYVEVDVDFPLLRERHVPAPEGAHAPEPIHVSAPVPQKTRSWSLTPVIHQQLFTRVRAALRSRSNELKSGDLIALLGSSVTDPYHIIQVIDFELPYMNYRYVYECMNV